MLEADLLPPVEATVRGIASAARALRLYPPTSPIPRQSVEAAAGPLRSFLESQTTLTLTVSREGFTCRGTTLSSSIAGASDLADLLRSHGVAEVVFSGSCGPEDLLGLLGTIMHAPELLRPQGGVTAALAAAGVQGVRLVTVSLTTTAEVEERRDGDVDEFFRELAVDQAKLATWLAAAANGDPATLAEGLEEIAKAAGVAGDQSFLDTLAGAFGMQETDGKDVLLGIGMEEGAGRDLVGGMLGRLPDGQICESLSAGVYGKNMLSLSTALTRLPLGTRMDEIIAEVRASLPKYGHDAGELEFLDHMVDVRKSNAAEQPLAVGDKGFVAAAKAAEVDAGALASKREEVAHSVAHTAAMSVPTMLALLDQQQDFNLYVKSLDGLALLVPTLVREQELGLAVQVLREISDRGGRTDHAWPELSQRLREAMSKATSHATMVAVLQAVTQDAGCANEARQVLGFADDAGKRSFVEEALARHDDAALDAAESLLGRRVVDALAAAVPHVGAGQLGPLVRRLVAYGDPVAMEAVHDALRRPEELARAQAAEAMAGATNPMAVRHLAALLKDPSERVVVAAARSLSRTPVPGSASALAARLDELDVDNKDFALTRELVGCLAQMPDPVAEQALKRLRDRKALIKRGHFADVQRLASEALAAQAQRRAR